jgi:hypothetical protein
MFTLRFDMRAPVDGVPTTELYRAAIEMAAWGEEHGCLSALISEHHTSPDGYIPSPLILASAIAARTKQMPIVVGALLLNFYDPIKLAEDAAVVQLATGGRLLLGIGGGYRPSEFETFGRRLEDRWRVIGETVELLRLAWTGEPFTWQGRRCHVTPRPDPPPPILLGGGTPAAARRAARIADGWFPPLEPKLWPPYREACLALGKPDPGDYPKQGPIFLWISKEPEKDWDRVTPHVLHQLQSYTEWTIEAYGRPAGPYAKQMTAETIRQSPAYQVLTPVQTLALAEQLGSDSVFYLNPLLSGIDPARARTMLDLYEREVHPYLPR